MKRPWSGEWLPLAMAARAAMAHSSGRPRRGAAIEDQDGRIHSGAAIAPPDLPAAALCAEHAAIAAICASGSRNPRRLVILGPPPAGASQPCGRCLQVLLEFVRNVEIRWGTASEERGRSDLRRLLPDPFDDYRKNGSG